ncbi:fibrocystin [Pseudophryne corroboree]|uniref:fibrocystin n=1 Tax=Pseudophryne corroboree TaxID=495146 RepID=UPI003081E6B9
MAKCVAGAHCLTYTAQPEGGSTGGGTLVTILFNGSGMGNQCPWYTGDGPPFEVHMTNPERPRMICDLQPTYSPSASITCKTRPSGQEDWYELEVFCDGQLIKQTTGIMFQFSELETPVIHDVSPSHGVPGDVINISGRIMTQVFENYDFNIDFIESPVILTADRDRYSSLCTLADMASGKIYPIQVKDELGALQCKLEGDYIGSQNVTLSIFNKGRAIVSKEAWRISAKQELFLYQTHSEILSISPGSGSTEGGTDIHIIGDFFMHPARVSIAGNPCAIKYLTPRLIICTTAPQRHSQQAPHPGNRGLLYELWDGLQHMDMTEKPSGYQRSVVPNASSALGIVPAPEQRFRARLSGFFVSPETNNYTFWIQSDSEAQLFISQSEEAERKVEVASIPQGITEWTDHWERDWDRRWKQKSPKMELSRGRKYYIEMLQRGTGPASNMKIGVQIHNTWLSPEVIQTYQRERHQIVAESAHVPDIQKLDFAGVGLVQFCWDNVTSKPVDVTSTAEQIQAVVEDLLSVHCVTDLATGDVFLHSGFEGTDEAVTYGMRAGWEEPYCGRFSIFMPKYILKDSRWLHMRYELHKFSHVCFAYRGYLGDHLLVTLTYNSTFLSTVTNNYTCQWKFNETLPERWNFGCTDLRTCLRDSLDDATTQSSVYVDQILLLQRENDQKNWYWIDELIIAKRGTRVVFVDPKAARPGGHLLPTVSITGTYPSYNLTALVASCGINLPLIELCRASAESPGDGQQAHTAGNGTVTLVVTRLQAASPPIGGTFSIRLSDTVIPGIPVHTSPANLRDILVSNSDNLTAQYINVTDFTVTEELKTCHQIVWTLTWTNMTGDLPNLILVHAENLTGLNPSIITRVVFDGGVFIGPIFGDMLASSHSLPQVTVHINDIPAQCSGSCAFQHLLDVTPMVTDIQNSAGDGCDFVVKITGSGFHGSFADIDVKINETDCNVIDVDTSSIACCMDTCLPLGHHQVRVHVKPLGFAMNGSGNAISMHLTPRIASVFPSLIPQIGGQLISVRGIGFQDVTMVVFGSQQCPLYARNFTTVICRAPSQADTLHVKNITMKTGQQWISFPELITFDPSLNPVILSISPNVSNTAGDQVSCISLSNFDNNTLWEIEVAVHKAVAKILRVTSHSIEVILPQLSPGLYNVTVSVNGISLTANGFQPTVRYILEMFRLEPCCGSFMGGTVISIFGKGFSSNTSLISVTVGGQPCRLLSSTEDVIECQTPPYLYYSSDEENMTVPLKLSIANISSEKEIPDSINTSGLVFAYHRDFTPTVSNLTWAIENGSLWLLLAGLNATNSVILFKNVQRGMEYKTNYTELQHSGFVIPLHNFIVGKYRINVYSDKLGFANITSEEQTFEIVHTVSSFSPEEGPLCGGTVLTIFGSFYASTKNTTTVTLTRDYACSVVSVNSTAIKCALKVNNNQNISFPVYVHVAVIINGVPGICERNCTFRMVPDQSPVVNEILASLERTTFVLYVLGQRLNERLQIVVDRSLECRVASWNETMVRCHLEDSMTPGNHTVRFPSAGDGDICLLLKPFHFSIAPQITKMYPLNFGNNGGGCLTIEGVGLQGRNSTIVLVGHLRHCVITTANYTMIKCMVPPGNGTLSVIIQVDNYNYTTGNVYLEELYTPVVHTVLERDSVLVLDVSGVTAIDHVHITVGDYNCTNVYGNTSAIQCSVSNLPAGRYGIQCLDRERGWATSNITVAFPIAVTSLRNNIDCMESGTLHISGTGFSRGNTFVSICGSHCDMYNHLTTPTDVYCANWRLNSSLAFLCDLTLEAGARCHENRNTFIQCEVTVQVGDFRVTQHLAYVHVCHHHWICGALSVPAGTVRIANITGLFISPKVEGDEVLIYNGSCNITIETEAEIECEALNQPITAQITAIRKKWLHNTQGGNISFHLCSLWSEDSSWPSGHPPVDGDNVTVERGRTLRLDTSTSLLNLLHIKGGKLVLTGPGSVHLRAHYILISDGGELQAGTSTHPYIGKANITLYGSSYSTPLYPYGVKFLAVRNGTISMHGWIPRFISTHLAVTARANDTTLRVMDPVDWRVGDEVVLCGADPVKLEEVLTVHSINGTQISVRPPLRYDYGILEQYIEADWVYLRPIVALLTRDITVKGNLTEQYMARHRRCRQAGVPHISECRYGKSEKILGSQDLGSVFIAQALKDEPSLIQISGVGFLYAGQTFRKPFCALSIVGDVPMCGSYIRGCVVRNTFARGISLSGISQFTVEENIFYNTKGHSLMIGEHSEDHNNVKHNLFIRISGTTGLSNIETLAPAAIYIRSPSSAIEGNMVCTAGYGFFYHLSPDGPSHAHMGTFKENTAVSCMRSGFALHPEYQPRHSSQPATFQGFTAWKSRGGAQIARCGNVSFKEFKIYSCKEFGINISESAGNTEVSDSLLLGHLDGGDSDCMVSGINAPKRIQMTINNTLFINFDRPSCSAVRTCSGCIRGQGGFTVKTQRLRFINSTEKYFFPFPHCAMLEDIDGSLTGSVGSHLLPSLDILPDACRKVADVSVCDAHIKFHRMSIGLGRAPRDPYSVTVINTMNQTTTVNYVPDTLSNLFGWQALLLDKETYTVLFHSPDMDGDLRYSATFDDFAEESYMYVRHCNLSSVINVSITCGWRDGNPHLSIPTLGDSGACDWFFDSKRGVLTYLVAGEGQVRVTLTAERMMTTPTPPPAPGPQPHPVFKWSSPESWEGVGAGWGGHSSTTPRAGEDVIILPNRTVVVDIALPPLGGLYVIGTLVFPAHSSNVLSVTCILIAGGELRIGTGQQPLEWEQRLRIHLRASEGIPCDRWSGLSVYPGAIGVYGKLQIHSAYPSRSWTRLGSDIAPGNEMIAVNGTLDWRPGDQFVIGSSSYEAHQAELVNLRDIYGYIVRIWGKLDFWHSGTVHNIGDIWKIPLTAEVGLLSRNVQIETDISCSGRIMVGQYTNDHGQGYLGSLELFNVEISNFGSPQFSAITFTNISHGSSISSTSIHHSCGGGISAVSSASISLHDNVIYNSVGHGIHLDGDNHTLTNNLIILSRQPDTQSEWVTGIKINLLGRASLSGNAVAGSERIAFHVRGQGCDSEDHPWQGNVAHSSLHGLHVYWDDGFKNCTKIAGFLSYKNYDYGLIFHLESSVVVENVALLDNGVGVLPIVSQQSIDSYNYLRQYITIRNSLIVATSPAFDCIRDRIKPLSANVTMRDRAPVSPLRGRVGILWPTFTARPRTWPDFPWHMLCDGAVSGIMKLQDVTFSGIKRSCYRDDTDTCIMSNPENMAIMCPVIAERTKMVHIRYENIFYFHPPVRAPGCPSSIECSGMRTALFKDLDGTMLDLSPPVTVFPKSGPPTVLPCFNMGIYKKDDVCTYKSEARAQICQQIGHTVLILENIADVAEPISPVLSITDDFVQAFVSGQTSPNHCCDSKNHTTFYSILPANKISKVCFSGPTPKAMRLQLNGGQNSTKLVIALFYDTPNSFYIVSRGRKYSTVVYDAEPNFQNKKQGSSFFSFRENLLYVVLQGDEPVEIWTHLSIHLFFYVAPETNVDVHNQLPLELAHFLRIDPARVRVIQTLQGSTKTLQAMMDNRSKLQRHCPLMIEDRIRVRRHSAPDLEHPAGRAVEKQDAPMEVLIVEISHPTGLVQTVASGTTVTSSSVHVNLQSIANRIIGALQEGELETALPLQIDSLMVIEPTHGSSSSNIIGSRSTLYVRPHRIYIEVQPVGGTTGRLLLTQPKVAFLDIQGNRVKNLGHSSSRWFLSVYLKGSASAPLKGNTTVEIEDGWGNFSNLVVSSSGSNWCLIFNVTSPPGVMFSVQSKEFQVSLSPSRDRENTFLLVVLSSAASAIAVLLFCCCFLKRKKGKRLKAGAKLRR